MPGDRSEVVKVKARATKYALINYTLYRRSFSGSYQRCDPLDEAKKIIEQVYEGVCGYPHRWLVVVS